MLLDIELIELRLAHSKKREGLTCAISALTYQPPSPVQTKIIRTDEGRPPPASSATSGLLARIKFLENPSASSTTSVHAKTIRTDQIFHGGFRSYVANGFDGVNGAVANDFRSACDSRPNLRFRS
ncbi:hypothetical protein L1987_71074 [Smallanthus sonchifolius]|uniref:Uncharacterized protein n=1 Tax=Smallanthus sonchifolius TaxID=185202 RepID=A0ACB9AS28_9ASTR|nr:hypothetical protein L1987_71074 [Smallanthus sonchifolius]